jgi:hypothetical protein
VVDDLPCTKATMAVCWDDNDRTLDHAYISSTSGEIDGILESTDVSDDDDGVIAVVAVGDGDGDGDGDGGVSGGDNFDDGVDVATTDSAIFDTAAAGATAPLATVSNRLSSSFPPDSFSRAFMTSCKDGHRWVRL